MDHDEDMFYDDEDGDGLGKRYWIVNVTKVLKSGLHFSF